MKPIIIYPEKDGKITLTKEQFEKYIQDAYDNGYSEGVGAKWYIPYYPYYPSYPSYPTYPTVTWGTSTSVGKTGMTITY